MKLSLTFLYETLKEQHQDLKLALPKGRDTPCGAILFRRKETEPPVPETLYALLPENFLQEYEKYESANIAFLMPEDMWADSLPHPALLYPAGSDALQLIQDITYTFLDMNAWENKLTRALLRGESRQSILKIMAKFLHNPVYFADRSFQMLDEVGYVQPEISTVWRYQKEYGFLPPEVAMSLINSGEFDEINSAKQTVYIRTRSFPKPYMARAIRYHGEIQGYFFIIETFQALSQRDREASDLLGSLLEDVSDKDTPYLKPKGFDHEHFLLDVLAGTRQEELLVHNQLREFGWDMTKTFMLLVIDAKDSTELIRRNLINMLCSGRNATGFFFHSHLVILYRNPHKNQQELLTWIGKCLDSHNYIGAMSEQFSDFSSIRSFYDQALYALENRPPQAGTVSFFGDCYLPWRARLTTASVPPLADIQNLKHHDDINQTSYCRTLYTWLTLERNTVAAANALFLHRNTMKYRLNRIREILNSSLDDFQYRERCLDSLQVILFPEKEKN